MPSRTIVLNGRTTSVSVPDDAQQLLYILREQCDQRGPKFGCGVAQCGACTVIVNGTAIRSCTTPLSAIPEGAAVRTLDGLAVPDGEDLELHPLQKAIVAKQAAQCAFCINGMIMGSLAWLEGRIAAGNTAVPSRQDVADHLSGATPENVLNYLCRCGAHNRIIEAVRAAAKEMAG